MNDKLVNQALNQYRAMYHPGTFNAIKWTPKKFWKLCYSASRERFRNGY